MLLYRVANLTGLCVQEGGDCDVIIFALNKASVEQLMIMNGYGKPLDLVFPCMYIFLFYETSIGKIGEGSSESLST